MFVLLCVSALGVDMISQPPRVRSEGLGAQAVRGRAGISGETSEAVGLDLSLYCWGNRSRLRPEAPWVRGAVARPACS